MRKMSKAFVAIATIGSLVVTGCGSDSLTIPTGNGQVTVSSSDDKTAVVETKDANGNTQTTTFTGEGKLPEKFPKEIPIPDGATIQAAITSNDSMTVAVDIAKNFDDTLKIYKDYITQSGYSNVTETLIEDSYMASGDKDGNQVLITISKTTDDPNLMNVAIVYGPKK